MQDGRDQRDQRRRSPRKRAPRGGSPSSSAADEESGNETAVEYDTDSSTSSLEEVPRQTLTGWCRSSLCCSRRCRRMWMELLRDICCGLVLITIAFNIHSHHRGWALPFLSAFL